MSKAPRHNAAMQHPEEETLLRFADGELAVRERHSVRGHLEACWQCRARLEELQRTIGEAVRYRESLKRFFPPPPSPWCDIHSRMTEADAAPGRLSLWERAKGALRLPRLAPRWVAAAALAVTGVFLLEYLTNAPTAEAAVLLQKAVAAAESQPKPAARRVRVRTRRSEFVRDAVAATPARTSGEEAAVAEMVRKAGYDWENPLDARSFSRWRGGLASSRDELVRTDDAYCIRTETGTGSLIAATLKLSAADLRAIEARLEFRNEEWVEFSELPAAPPAAEVSRARVPTVAEPAGSPTPGGSATPPSTVRNAPTASDEVRVFEALHRLGADLGEPVEVTRTDEDILVTALGPSAARAREFEQALAAIPNVRYRAMAPMPGERQPGADSAVLEAGPTTNPAIARIQERLTQSLKGRTTLEQFSSRALDATDQVMARAHALRRLAERFPSEVEPQLNPEAREMLARMRLQHGLALQAASLELERVMDPVLQSMGGAAPVETTAPGGPWQRCAQHVFDIAGTAERHIGVLLGGAASAVAPAEIPSRLRQSLRSLRTNAANCEW